MERIVLLSMATIAFLAVTLFSFGAEIYKCVLDGKTTFSQRPCEGEISTVTVKDTGTAPDNNSDYIQKNKELDEVINKRRADRKLRGLKQDLVVLKKRRDKEIALIRSQMRSAATKADVLIMQQHIANRREEWNERIREKQGEIESAKAAIGPGEG